MASEKLTRFVNRDGEDSILTSEVGAALVWDVFDCTSVEELDLLVRQILRRYARPQHRRKENAAELEPIRVAVITRRRELRGR